MSAEASWTISLCFCASGSRSDGVIIKRIRSVALRAFAKTRPLRRCSSLKSLNSAELPRAYSGNVDSTRAAEIIDRDQLIEQPLGDLLGIETILEHAIRIRDGDHGQAVRLILAAG